MYFSCQALALAALALEGALAQPAHRHAHKHPRDLADVLEKRIKYDLSKVNWAQVDKTVDWSKVDYSGKGNAPPAVSVAPSVPAPVKAAPPVNEKLAVKGPAGAPAKAQSSSTSKAQSSSASTGKCSNLSDVWTHGDTSRSGKGIGGSACDGGCTSADMAKQGVQPWTDKSTGGASKEKRATAEQDGYVGNVGSTYGMNIVPLSSCDKVSDHQYTITFNNKEGRPIQVAMWNKVGDDGKPQSGPSRNSFFMFNLAKDQSAAFAFETNSQIAFSEACGRQPDAYGVAGDWDCIWGEADFGDKNAAGNGGNTGGSGYDVSTEVDIANAKGQLTVYAEGMDKSSRSHCGFTSVNQFSAGPGCNVNPTGAAHLQADFGVDA